MEQQYFVDFVEIDPCCRICNCMEGSMNILTEQLQYEGVLLHEALEFVTCLKVDTDDGMSQSLCLSCSRRLLDAFRFKNQALDSYKTFYDLSSNIHCKKGAPLDEDETQSQLDVNVHNTADDNIPAGPDTLATSQEKPEIDMSTDAVAFLIEHHLKNSKKNPPQTASSTADWIPESIRQNPRTKYSKYECQVCDRKFRKKSNLVDHLRLHANVKKFACSYCGKSFVQMANYQMHLRTHTKERPFQCKICQKSYSQSSSLKIHIRSHTQERNYLCPVCDKGFTNSSDLSKHRRRHDPSQQFKCEYCGKFFAQKVNMKTHQKRHHFEICD